MSLRGLDLLALINCRAAPEGAGDRLVRRVGGRAVDLQEQVDRVAGVGGEVHLHRLWSERTHRPGVHPEELGELVRRLADADPDADPVGAGAAVHGA